VPKNEQVLRFAVGTDVGPRSAVWRIWTNRDDVYVQSNYSGGAIKTSLHASGRFRHAFSEEEASRWVSDGEDRAFEKWSEPDREPGNARLVLEIRIPTDELTIPTQEPEPAAKSKIKFIEPAPPGWEVVASIFLVSPEDDEVMGAGKTKLGALPAELIENWPLATRGRVFIFVTQQQPGPEFPEQMAAVRRDIAGQVGQVPSEEGHQRIALFGHDHEKGVACYIDLAGHV
jgi:hypothetical protein